MPARIIENSNKNIQSEKLIFPPEKEKSMQSHINVESKYTDMYERSLREPEKFWIESAAELSWFKFPKKALKYSPNSELGIFQHTWFEDGILNVSFNCLDRHLVNGKENKPAIIFQGQNEKEVKSYTFKELHEEVCRLSNLFKSYGINKGDRICIYLPVCIEAVCAMLASSRIGAIHSVVFGGFSAEALAYRINHCQCKIVITSDVTVRGKKKIFLKKETDIALQECPSVEHVLVVKKDPDLCEMNPHRDRFYHEEIAKMSPDCSPEPLQAEDPLFILYTSGSTGKPKGVVHSQAGYLLHASLSHKYIFDIREDDRYWCTADPGWITGHSYVVYGPLANGCTTYIYDGLPDFPDPGRCWKIIKENKITVFYTAPTLIRSLMREGESWPQSYDLSSLRILGSVGEPINPNAWMWYYQFIGNNHCRVIDTWWQTETGGIMIAPFPGCHTLKPGSASRPFFGVEPIILRDDGSECAPNESGNLCMKRPWPGMMRTIWNDRDKFIETYFTQFPGLYFTGDGAFIDSDGDYWLSGRVDDVVNIAGHRLGTAEIESALVNHPSVAEAAVVSVDDSIKGEALYAFVTPIRDCIPDETLRNELFTEVRKIIGAIAVPQTIQFTSALPKTRSGKIMRRLLKKIASKKYEDLGDVSTLADPLIIKNLIKGIF